MTMLEHSHHFLAADHTQRERKTWVVIAVCGAMMAAEVVGGLLFGSIALVADGLHMSTHAGALLLAALAYRYARQHAEDARFSFGTGKLGDLAAFASALVLAMIALLIGYEALLRLLRPAPINFAEAVPIACAGLAVNLLSAWLLGGQRHAHEHTPLDEVTHAQRHAREPRPAGARGHLHLPGRAHHGHPAHPHGHSDPHRDNNLRAALVHVAADAAVSVMVIVGLLLARHFGWLWMDPAAALVGALVIGSWSYRLMHDAGSILLDMNPDRQLTDWLRQMVEKEGDRIVDLHLWRVGPGHLAAILSVVTDKPHQVLRYHSLLRPQKILSHLTVQVVSSAPANARYDSITSGAAAASNSPG